MKLKVKLLEVNEYKLRDDQSNLGSPSLDEAKVTEEIDKHIKITGNAEQRVYPPQILSEELCDFLNEYWPETVSADPLKDLQVLRLWKTGSRQYAFHTPYPPLYLQRMDKKSPATGPTEAIGSMMAAVVSYYENIRPIVRCVGSFPDLVYQNEQTNPFLYYFVEAKASVSSKADKHLKDERQKFLKRAIAELNAKVCNKCMLVNTKIILNDPIEVEVRAYIVSLPSSLSHAPKNIAKGIFPHIKPHLEQASLDKQNIDQTLDAILNSDEKLVTAIQGIKKKELEQIQKVAETSAPRPMPETIQPQLQVNGEQPLSSKPELIKPDKDLESQIKGPEGKQFNFRLGDKFRWKTKMTDESASAENYD